MAIDPEPFGLAFTHNLMGFALGAVQLVWDPANPRPIPPGNFDARTTAIRRLYYQFSRDVEGWRALADYVGLSFQVASDQMADFTARHLPNAFGQILDQIGAGVALPRRGLGDGDYRRAIRVRGASLDSDGTIRDLLSIIEGLFGAVAATGAYAPWYPAAFALFVPAVEASEAALLAFLLGDAIPAGVGAALVVTDVGAPGWSFSDGATVDDWLGPRWDFSGGSDISATGPWGFALTLG